MQYGKTRNGQSLSWIPDQVLVIILGTLSVVVIYKIMGREG